MFHEGILRKRVNLKFEKRRRHMSPIDNRDHNLLERSIAELDIATLVNAKRVAQPYYPSPPSWADQVLYFLMVDRFSDGDESGNFQDGAGVVHNCYLDNNG